MNKSRKSGFVLVIVSAIVFSTAGLFAKGVEADAWTIIFWRGLFAVFFTFVYLAVTGRLRGEIATMRFPAWLTAFIGGCGTAAFIAAFKHTSIANVALIYATAPFAAALFSWIIIGERPTLLIMGAASLALVGVAIVVQGSVGTNSLFGDLLALIMVICMALMLTVYRKYPDTPAGTSTMLSSLMLVVVAMIVASPFIAPLHEIAIMAAFGLVFAVASVTLVEGALRISPAESTLIGALESPLAPVWAYLVFAELPGISTVVGGAVILLAVFGWQYMALREEY